MQAEPEPISRPTPTVITTPGLTAPRDLTPQAGS